MRRRSERRATLAVAPEGERDPMMQLRGLRPVVLWCIAALAAGAGSCAGSVFAQSDSDMTLTGILLGPTPVAIIRASGVTFITKVGEPVGDAVVMAILPSKVVLRQGKATLELSAPLSHSPTLGAAAPRKGAASAPAVRPGVPAVPASSLKPTPVGPPAVTRAVPAAPAGAPPGIGMTVTGILEGKSRVAIVQAGGQSYVAGAGDRVGDAVVVSILPHKVVLKRNGTLVELHLSGAAGRRPST